MRYMTDPQIAEMLKRRIASEGMTQKQWAERAGIPESYFTDFLKGRRAANAKLLKAAGFEPDVYRKGKS